AGNGRRRRHRAHPSERDRSQGRSQAGPAASPAGAYRWPMVEPAVTPGEAVGAAAREDGSEDGSPARGSPRRPGRRGTFALLAAFAVVLIGGLAIGFARQTSPTPAPPEPSLTQVRSDPLVALIDRKGALTATDGV